MGGLEKIIEQIQGDAAVKADDIVSKAKAEADEILEKAKAESQESVAAIRKKSASDVKKEEERLESSKEMYERTATLKVKQEVISEVADKAYEKVAGLETGEYFNMIERMIEKYALPQDGEIIFSGSDRERMPEGFTGRITQAAGRAGGSLKLSSEERDIENGFVLVYGGIEENCTIRAIFDANREKIQDIANSLLYGKEA